MTSNPNGGRRRILMLAGVLPALLVLAFALKVALMLDTNATGRDDFGTGDYDGAAMEFADNQRLNWFEAWIAAFNEGAGLHADGAWPDAITAYEAALEDVPDREECTVRINLALVHEAIGDSLQEDGNTDKAITSWMTGSKVLVEGDCPTDAGRGEEQTEDAETLDERLRAKVEQNQPQDSEEDPKDSGDGPDKPDDGQKDPRQERLDRNNQQGLEQRREDQELYDDDDYSNPNSW